MRKAERLFQLTNLIRAKQPITAERIAEELGVSVRTVYRYIDDISLSGIPIYGTTGIGYQLDEGFELPPLNLSDSELDALILGVRMVSGWTGDELAQSANALLHKIESVLPKHLQKDCSSFSFPPDFTVNKAQRRLWDQLNHAVNKSYILHIDYTALSGAHSTRTIYPLGLFYWGSVWTLGSWCTKRQDFRNFRVDHITKLATDKITFTKDDTINLQNYLSAESCSS